MPYKVWPTSSTVWASVKNPIWSQYIFKLLIRIPKHLKVLEQNIIMIISGKKCEKKVFRKNKCVSSSLILTSSYSFSRRRLKKCDKKETQPDTKGIIYREGILYRWNAWVGHWMICTYLINHNHHHVTLIWLIANERLSLVTRGWKMIALTSLNFSNIFINVISQIKYGHFYHLTWLWCFYTCQTWSSKSYHLWKAFSSS